MHRRHALHITVVLSKAAHSGPSVCLRARAPCPLRVSCPVTDRAQSALLYAPPPPGSRGQAAGMQACVPVAPWVKTHIPRHPEGAHAKCGVMQAHTGEVCSYQRFGIR